MGIKMQEIKSTIFVKEVTQSRSEHLLILTCIMLIGRFTNRMKFNFPQFSLKFFFTYSNISRTHPTLFAVTLVINQVFISIKSHGLLLRLFFKTNQTTNTVQCSSFFSMNICTNGIYTIFYKLQFQEHAQVIQWLIPVQLPTTGTRWRS